MTVDIKWGPLCYLFITECIPSLYSQNLSQLFRLVCHIHAHTECTLHLYLVLQYVTSRMPFWHLPVQMHVSFCVSNSCRTVSSFSHMQMSMGWSSTKFELLNTVSRNAVAFRDEAPCSLVQNFLHYKGILCLPGFKFLPRCKWDFRFPVMLRGVDTLLLTDVFRQPIGPKSRLDPWRWNRSVVPKRR